MRCDEHRRRIALGVFVICSTALLCGADCVPWIQTEDVGGYWEKASIDPALDGRWYSPDLDEDNLWYRFARTKEGAYHVIGGQTDREGKEKTETILQARTLTIDGHRFLMVKSSPSELARDIERAKKEGRPIRTNDVGLWRYTVDENELTFYRLRNDALVKAAEDARWKDVIKVARTVRKTARAGEPKEVVTASIPQLNADAVRLLKWLADTPDNWEKEKDGALSRKPPKREAE